MTHADTERKEHKEYRESWHLSKEVPIALIGTLLITIVSVAIGWSKMDSRVEAVEKSQVESKLDKSLKENRLDNKLDQIQNDITKIKDQFLEQARSDLLRERGRR